jgi:hypothetical protein
LNLKEKKVGGEKGVREEKIVSRTFYSRKKPEPPNYLQWLNASQPKEEIENIRSAIRRSRPYGSKERVSSAVAQLGLENTLPSRGRPEKVPDSFSH